MTAATPPGRIAHWGEPGWRRLVFPPLLVTFGLAYLWRISGLLPVASLTDHLSNFYLTGAAVVVLSGPASFVDAGRRARAVVVAGLFAGLNLVVEIALAVGNADEAVNRAMGDVNTSDPVDGVFGLAATALVLALLPPRQGADRNRINLT